MYGLSSSKDDEEDRTPKQDQEAILLRVRGPQPPAQFFNLFTYCMPGIPSTSKPANDLAWNTHRAFRLTEDQDTPCALVRFQRGSRGSFSKRPSFLRSFWGSRRNPR